MNTQEINMLHPIGAVHYNFPGFNFEQFVQFVSRHGGHCVEVQIYDIWDEKQDGLLERSNFAAASARAYRVRDLLASHGLFASSISARNDFVQRSSTVIEEQVARMELIGELARILGDDTLLRSEGGQPKDIPVGQWLSSMYECFSRCTKFAERLNIGLAIDNHGEITNDAELLSALLQQVNHPYIGTNLDTMNYRWYGYSVEECNDIYQAMAPYALQVHLKDGTGSRSSYRGAALGSGELDLKRALDTLEQAGYCGAYLAEYEGTERENGIGYGKCLGWIKQNVSTPIGGAFNLQFPLAQQTRQSQYV